MFFLKKPDTNNLGNEDIDGLKHVNCMYDFNKVALNDSNKNEIDISCKLDEYRNLKNKNYNAKKNQNFDYKTSDTLKLIEKLPNEGF